MKPLSELRHSTGFALLFFLVSLLLAGCGGGGGSAPVDTSFGNSLPPSTGTGDVENLFPNTVGTSWNYFATVTNPLAGAPSSYMDSITVTGTKVVGGQTASVFLESNPYGLGIPGEGYYFKNDGGVAFLGTNDATDTLTAGIVPYIIGLFPVTTGVVAHFDKNGLDFGADLDSDGINETANVTLTSTVWGFEPLTIGIGSFSRTVKSREALTGLVVLSQSKIGIPFSSATTRWSAPGIGVIKTSESTTVQSVTSSETMEARGYTSNGVAHGFGLPFTVANNLASGDSNYTNPGSPALATDGQNYLAVSANSTAMKGVIFDTQGTHLHDVVLASGASPVAGYDGSNYWVIYSDALASACLAQRVTPAGAVVDATPINLVTVGSGYTSITSKGFGFGKTNGLLAYSIYNNMSNQHELHGVLVKPDSTVSAPFSIATDPSTHLHPSVAFDGTNFLVVWEQQLSIVPPVGNIYGVLVSDTGSLIDVPFPISTAANGQYSPRVAFDGTNYLVVWLDLRNQAGVPYPDLYGMRVTTAGTLLDGDAVTGGFPISSGGTQQRYSPSVAFTGAEYLTAWSYLGYASTGSPGVQVARVSTSGTLPSGADMAITVSGPPNEATVSQYVYPVIAAGPQHAAIVWLDNTEPLESQKSFLGTSVFPF
jgi:hypothetical protein